MEATVYGWRKGIAPGIVMPMAYHSESVRVCARFESYAESDGRFHYAG